MILFSFLVGLGSGLKVSGNSYEFYDNSEVFNVFCRFSGYFFAFFDEYFVLLAQMGIEETPST